MTTLFDFLTVGCFLAMVAVFFLWTERDTRTLLNFLLSGIVFGVANQVGNAGWTMLAALLVLAGAGYIVLSIRR